MARCCAPRWPAHGAQLKKLAEEYELNVDPDALIEDIGVGMQQRVEILKALYRQADILILDEPTGVLTPAEADHLFRILESLKREGKTIILITHKLREIMEITDTVSVMRRGEMTATVKTAETSPAGTGRADGRAQGAAAGRQGARTTRRQGAGGQEPAASPTTRASSGSRASASRCARARSSALPAWPATASPNCWRCWAAIRPPPAPITGQRPADRPDRRAFRRPDAGAPAASPMCPRTASAKV